MTYFAVASTMPANSADVPEGCDLLRTLSVQCVAQNSWLHDAVEPNRAAFADAVLVPRQASIRNFAPIRPGDQVATFLTVEEPTPSGLRLCFRTLMAKGLPVAAGFQDVLFTNAVGDPQPVPKEVIQHLAANLDLVEVSTSPNFAAQLLSDDAPHKLFPAEISLLADRVCRSDRGMLTGRESRQPLATPLATGPVLVFPGQGSFDLELLVKLAADPCCTSADTLVTAADLEAIGALGFSFRELLNASAKRQATLLRDCPDLDQYGIFVTGLLLAEKAESLGALPSAAAGHSLGEITALCAAGALAVADGLRVISTRIIALRTCGVRGGMLAVQMDREAAEALLDPASRAAGCVVAVVNHPGQTVISGPEAELDRIAGFASDKSLHAVRLASRMPFHSPALAPAALQMASALRAIVSQQTRFPVLSPILGSTYTADARLGIELASHLVRPVDWPGAMRALLQAGATAFIECGACGALSRFTGRLAAERVAAISGERLADSSDLGQMQRPGPTNTAAKAPSAIKGAVAIVAMGAVVPGASDVATFWQNCLDGSDGVRDLRDLDPNYRADFSSEGITPDKNYSCLFGMVEDQILPPAPSDRTTRAERFLDEALRQCVQAKWQKQAAARQVCLLGSTADGVAEYDDALFAQGVRDAIEKLPRPDGLTREELASALRALPWWHDGDPEQLGPYPLLRKVVDRRLGTDVDLTLLDAACASSLYAIDSGMRLLTAGTCDTAYVGGVFSCGPSTTALFAQFGGLSRAGSRPFDAAADGAVFGEGAAVLVLKRLEDAIAANDPIHGVIRSVGLSSDGRAPAVNVPRVAGQSLAIRNAYINDLHPGTIQYIEAHATATPVGDATEFKSLSESFANAGARQRIALGSVKALVGHLGWLAGVASVIKVVKALEAGTLPPQHRFEKPSPKIDLEASPFTILKEPTQWPTNRDGLPRRAAISGFGFGGTNAHLVVEEFNPVFHAKAASSADNEDSDVIVAVAVGAAFSDGTATWSPQPGSRAQAYETTAMRAPRNKRLLPDAAEQMDACQFLLLDAAGQVIEVLGDTAPIRERVGILIGSPGKNRRSPAANERIFADRLIRSLGENLAATALGSQAATAYASSIANTLRSRQQPSSAYTLLGLMPNVMTGRVANLYDLMGPNMVLDAGPSSILASFRAADRLLRDRACDVVLAGGINATAPWPRGGFPAADPGLSQDGACVVALTRRSFAQMQNLPILATVRVGNIGNDSLWIGQSASALQPRPDIIQAGRPHEVRGLGALANAFTSESALLQWEQPRVPQALFSPNWEQPHDVGFHIPVAIPAAPAEQTRQPFHGTAAFVADSPELAAAVHHALQQTASLAVMLPATADAADADLQAAALSLPLASSKALVIVTDLSTTPMHGVLLHEDAERLSEAAFAACREAFDCIRNKELAVIALAIGGWRDGKLHPSAALLSGFLKSLACEAPDALIRCVAIEHGNASAAARALETELTIPASPSADVDVIIRADGSRHVLRLAPLNPVAVQNQKARLDRSSVVLATGGGRGITAVMLAALMERYGCAAVVIGRQNPNLLQPEVASMDDAGFRAYETAFYSSALAQRPGVRMPQLRAEYTALAAARELAATLKTLARFGRVHYVQADVSDATAIDAAVREAASLHGGRLDLVLHGAGLQISKRLPARTLADWRRTLAAKLGGLRNLHAACARHASVTRTEFHLVSSVAGAVGNDGQADYAAANAALNALADALNEGPDGSRWSAIAWLGWQGAGMASGNDYTALFKGRGSRMLTPGEGRALFAALFAGEPLHAGVVVLPKNAEAVGFGRVCLAPPVTPELAKVRRAPDCILDPDTMPWLACHLVRGVPTLPGAFMADFLVQAAYRAGASGKHVLIEQIDFKRFLKVPFGTRVALRSRVEHQDGGFRVKLLTDFTHSSGRVLQEDVVHAEAFIRTGNRPFPLPANRLEANWKGHGNLRDPYLAQAGGVHVSGPYDSLSGIESLDRSRRARFQVPKQARGAMPASGALPALLLDAMFRLLSITPNGQDGDSFVPLSVHDIHALCGVDDHAIAKLHGPLALEACGMERHGPDGAADWGVARTPDGEIVLSFARCDARTVEAKAA